MEYSVIITVIIFAWILILALRIGTWLNNKSAKNECVPPKVEKACPPHSWRWEEQIGMENTYFIRCQRCRRLPGWDREAQ